VSDKPVELNTLCRRVCWKLHDAVPSAASGSQDIVTFPLIASTAFVKFKFPLPQKAVPGRQVHSMPEHVQVTPPVERWMLCSHPLAAQ
jgi:hypothetical protein